MTLVKLVPVELLRTTLAPLRGERTERGSVLAPLPLRVVALADGAYEVLDGFKRLALWRGEKRSEVPVVVESAEGVQMKARLLAANRPSRTSSPMDEARVVKSLVDEDGLSVPAVGKLLGRKKTWVSRRLIIAGKLAPELACRLDSGALALAVAIDLCAFGKGEQMRLAETVRRHALRNHEAQVFLATYRVALDAPTREDLLRDPRRATPPAELARGDAGGTLEARFNQVEQGLE